MANISKRAQDLPLSPIRKLIPLANAAKAKGTKVLHLNIGQPDIKTPPAFFNEINASKIDVLAYAESGGDPLLRKLIAKDYENYAVNLLSDQDVLVTYGGSEALQIALQVCLNPGDKLLMFEPFYANYKTFAVAANIDVISVVTKLEENFQLPETAEIEDCIKKGAKAILISNPDNPTGKVYSKAELLSLVELAEKYDLWLIVDEVYKDFVYKPAEFHSVFSLANKEALKRIIVIDSISKKFSACGARVGTLITKNEIVQAAAMKYAQARLSVGTLDQLGAIGLYKANLQNYLHKVNEEYKLRQSKLIEGLKSIPGVKVPEVHGAFYVMAELPVDTENFARWLLENYSKEGNTLMFAPGGGFYSDIKTGENQARIAYVLEVPKLELAVELLKDALSKYQQASKQV